MTSENSTYLPTLSLDDADDTSTDASHDSGYEDFIQFLWPTQPSSTKTNESSLIDKEKNDHNEVPDAAHSFSNARGYSGKSKDYRELIKEKQIEKKGLKGKAVRENRQHDGDDHFDEEAGATQSPTLIKRTSSMSSMRRVPSLATVQEYVHQDDHIDEEIGAVQNPSVLKRISSKISLTSVQSLSKIPSVPSMSSISSALKLKRKKKKNYHYRTSGDP